MPLHRQLAYFNNLYKDKEEGNQLVQEVVSLPMETELNDERIVLYCFMGVKIWKENRQARMIYLDYSFHQASGNQFRSIFTAGFG